jgi:hypothetical protein
MTHLWIDEWAGAAQAARMLGISVKMLKNLDPAELPFMRVGSRGDRRYRLTDIDRYITDHTVTERRAR